MNGTATFIIWLAAPALAATGFIWSLLRSKQRLWFRRILGGGCVALAIGIAMLVIPFAWVLRDGLAPGMVVSEGVSAIAHFVILYLIALLPVGALAIAAWALLRTPHKKEACAAS
jgi:hypothetical protein